MRNQADNKFGYRNPRLKMKVLGILNEGSGFFRKNNVDVRWFNDYVMNSAFGFMEKMQQREGETFEHAIDDRFAKLGPWLMSQPYLRKVLEGKMAEFMPAMKAWMLGEYEAGQFWGEKNKRAGLKVEDPKLGGKLRAPIAAGLLTFQRYFSPMFSNMVHALRLSGWATTGKDEKGAFGDFSTYTALKAKDPAAAAAMLAKYFDHETYGDTVKKDFFHLITHVPDESSFQGLPLDEMKSTEPVDPMLVARAADEAGGKPVETFERLFQLLGGEGSPDQFVQDSLVTLAEQFGAMSAALKKVEPTGSTEVSSLVGLVPNAMIDARVFPHWPSEYFGYHEFDRNTNARMAERISAQINYGRDGQDLANLHESVIKETNVLQSVLDNALSLARKDVPSGEKKKIDTEATKILARDKTPALQGLKTGEERLKYLRKIEERSPFLQQVVRQLSDYYRRGSDQTGSLKWGIRLAQFLSGLMVSNPASALSQMATTVDITAQWGASPMMLKATAGTIKMTAKDIAGSLIQALGMQMGTLSRLEKLFVDLGLNDAEVQRRFGDIMAVQEGEANSRAAKAARIFRIAKEAQSFTVNPRGEKAAYTPLRPLSPFYQSVFSANRGLTISTWKLAEDFVGMGVKYLKDNPGAKDLSAEKIGLKGLDVDSFNRWRADAARYGIRYEQTVANALERIMSGDKTLMTTDEYGKLYSLALNVISLEPNIATMSLSAFNNNFIRFAVPLLGWAWRRSLQTAEKLGGLDANDKRSLKAVGTGLLGFVATGLGGLGLSLAVDAYQEDVVGKKRNIRALRIPTTGADWVAIQERLNRIGTTGLWGELINGAVNVGTGQGDNRMLSVDQRVVALQSFQSVQRAISAFINQDFDPDYQHVVRPMIAAVGGNGMLQYMQIVNHAFDLDNVENRVVKRINAENYLRVTGRELGMSIRSGGAGYNTPTPITPWIARMEYAAYANNPSEFREMYQGAIEEAKKAGKSDPADYVKKSFETRHPLRYVFSVTPSERDYKEVLNNLDDNGREAVTDAVRLFNYYGAHLGLAPFSGSAKKDTKRAAGGDAAGRARALALP
jgi:hypothetical protein